MGQHQPKRVFQKAPRDPPFDGATRLAFGRPAGVRFKDRIELLVGRHGLAGQPAPVDRIGQPLRPLQNPLDLVQSSEVHPEDLPFPPGLPDPLHPGPTEWQRLGHPPEGRLDLSRAADAMEALLECSPPGLRLTPAADPIARLGIAQTSQQRTQRVPPPTDLRRVVPIGLDHERVTPPAPAPALARLFSPPPAPIPPPRHSPAPAVRASAH